MESLNYLIVCNVWSTRFPLSLRNDELKFIIKIENFVISSNFDYKLTMVIS